VKVCLISVEIFAWGKFGGFGRSTRMLGRELVNRGVEVAAVVPRRSGQRAVETLDGMTVYGFPMKWPFSMSALFRRIDADVYHSQHTSYGTAIALHSVPDKPHVVTFRDPKEPEDWWLEFRNPSIARTRVALNWLYEDSPAVRRAVRKLDARYVTAGGLNDRLRRIYGFAEPLDTLPTPIAIPPAIEKSGKPLVVFVCRLDRRKRPDVFCRLAEQFPEVSFVAVGRAQDAAFERSLRADFGHLPNLELAGFIDQFRTGELTRLLGRAWILVNTALREGVPTSFLEAMANRCAILSYVNPDGIAERFGHHAADDDFAAGLAWLLEGDRWRARGEAGRRFVQDRYDLERAVDKHMEVYRSLCRGTVSEPAEQY